MMGADDADDCIEPMVEPSQWIFSLLETTLSVGGVVLNTITTLVTHNAVPMPYSQRRMLASISFNFVLLTGFQLARNFFLFFAVQKPCWSQVTTVSCKLQDFPLLFCYIHCAVASFLLSLQSVFLKRNPKDKKRIGCSDSCSVWQSVVAAACISITLVFTAFDDDRDNDTMIRCSVLLAVKKTTLTFWLLTLLIFLQSASLLFIHISSCQQRNKKSWIAFTIYSIKDLLRVETVFWQLSLLLSGCIVTYRFVLSDTCEECSIFVLEITFVILPLIIALFHPVLLIWYVLPMRDAAAQAFPFILTVLPEYTLVPPQIPSASTSTNTFAVSPRTETTMSYDDVPAKTESHQMYTRGLLKKQSRLPDNFDRPESL